MPVVKKVEKPIITLEEPEDMMASGTMLHSDSDCSTPRDQSADLISPEEQSTMQPFYNEKSATKFPPYEHKIDSQSIFEKQHGLGNHPTPPNLHCVEKNPYENENGVLNIVYSKLPTSQ